MQGDPLVMIAYRIGILPLINDLKREIPDITHPWYADNAGALRTFARPGTYFYLLTRQGPVWGYHLEPSNIILISRPETFLEAFMDLRCA